MSSKSHSQGEEGVFFGMSPLVRRVRCSPQQPRVLAVRDRRRRSTKRRSPSSTRGCRAARAASSPARRRTSTRSARGLEQLGICTRRATSRGALMFRTAEEMYLYGGIFDPPRVLDHTDQLIDAALADGFTGLRLTARADARSRRRPSGRRSSGTKRWSTSASRAVRWPACAATRGRIVPAAARARRAAHAPDRDRARRGVREPVLRAPGDRPLATTTRRGIDWQFRQLRVQQRARQHLEGTRSSAVAAAAELAAELHHLRSGQKKPTKPD